MKLIRNKERTRLIEGRNKGISFAFVKRTRTEYKEVMPLSACKDYLNDVIWAEHQKETSKKIHGFIHEPLDLFKSGKVYLSTAKVTNVKKDDPTVYDLTNCLAFINDIEDSLGVTKTKVHTTDCYPVLQINDYWIQYPYLISMYCLFFRIAGEYNGKLEEFLSKQKGYGSREIMGSRALENYKFLLEHKPPLQPWDRTINQVHKQGIKTINLKILHENENKT